MRLIYFPDSPEDCTVSRIGGKWVALFELYRSGLPVPSPLCVSTDAYRLFVEHNGLGEKVAMALNRKDIQEMRWEEIWDISLVIRNLFLRGEMPNGLEESLVSEIFSHHGEVPLVVRSSASSSGGYRCR